MLAGRLAIWQIQSGLQTREQMGDELHAVPSPPLSVGLCCPEFEVIQSGVVQRFERAFDFCTLEKNWMPSSTDKSSTCAMFLPPYSCRVSRD